MSQVSVEMYLDSLNITAYDDAVPDACYDLQELFVTMYRYCEQLQAIFAQPATTAEEALAIAQFVEAFNAEILQATEIVNALQERIEK